MLGIHHVTWNVRKLIKCSNHYICNTHLDRPVFSSVLDYVFNWLLNTAIKYFTKGFLGKDGRKLYKMS